MSLDKQHIKEQIIQALKQVFDPEIPVDIWELGLIYDVKIDDSGEVEILMTLTSPLCPVAGSLPFEVQQKAMSVANVADVNVELTFDPPWSKDMMSDEARVELDMF